MKQFVSWLGKRMINGVVTGIFLMVTAFGITYALTYPGAPPVGEVAGGRFTAIFNNILQSGNYATDTTGKVKLATNADSATNVPWTGVTGKPTIISAEVDPKVGTLTAGKWCNSNGVTMSCTSDTPGGGGSLAAAIPALLLDGSLWDGTARCGTTPDLALYGCIRINGNNIQTKLGVSGVWTNGFLPGFSGTSLISYVIVSSCGVNGTDTYAINLITGITSMSSANLPNNCGG